MALNEKLFQHLQENLSRANGGGLHLKAADAELINTPILAIGLGGTGADALIRLKNLVKVRLNTSSDKDKPDNIEYLAIDSDAHTRNVTFNGTTFSDANSEVLIMEDAMLAQTYANLRSGQMPFVSEWISDEINVARISNGAGGVRQIGRFLFFKSFSTINTELAKKIRKITSGSTNRQKLYVFIMTGVSGGTGSGTYIDIPYIIRRLLQNNGFEAQVIGFIFMPDVNMHALPYEDQSTRRNIQRNGFAALKELDYLMNLGKGGNNESFEQEYGGGFRVSYEQAPYDICHLVSSINANGSSSYTKEQCMAVTAETILNFIADEKNKGGEEFTIAQYLSNIETTTDSFVTKLDKKLPIGYRYAAIGSSSGVLPMDDVLNYLTYLLFKQMNELYKKTPDPHDIESTITQLGIGLESITSAISANIVLQDIDLYTYDIIKNDPHIAEKVLQDCVDNVLASIMNKNSDNLLVRFRENAENKMNMMFIDLERGPAFVSKLIYSTEGQCLLSFIQGLLNGPLVNRRCNDVEIRRLKEVVSLTRKKLTDSSPLLGFNKAGLAKDHKKACVDLYSAILRNYLYDTAAKYYDNIYDTLNSINTKVFNVYTEMLTVLKTIFGQYAGIASDTKTETQGNTTLFSWNIIDPSVLTTEIELMINNDPDFKVNFKNVINNFVTDLINKSSEWLNTAKPNAAARLNDFIVNSFNTVARQSVDFYINRVTEGDCDRKNYFISDIMQKLTENAEVMFPINYFGANLNSPTYCYMSIPFNMSVFNDKLDGIGTVKRSVITNRIFMLKVNLAYPLVAYRELEQYEEVYESFTGKAAAGMHLYQKDGKNWALLPSPVHPLARSVASKNPKQDGENALLKEVFGKAVSYGYIEWDAKKTRHACYYGDKPYDMSAALPGYDIGDLENIPRANAQKALTTLKAALNGAERKNNCSYLYDVLTDKDNQPDTEYATGILRNMPALYKAVAGMVDEHEKILALIKALESKSKGYAAYSQFAACMYTGLIKKIRARYVYEDSKQLQKTLFEVMPDCPTVYYEYYVFNAFVALDEPERSGLYEKSRILLAGADDNDLNAYAENIKAMYEDFKTKRNTLASEYEGLADGLKIADFYTIIRDECEKALSLYV